MISRVSLFNSGIFKSTIKRNIWGSVIYFILLFLMTSMPLISNIDNSYFLNRAYNVPVIFRDSYLFLPVVMSVVVPTVVAMLVYRFLHSKRTAVFVHGLPVSRDANYISTLAAAFVVMALPVVANGIILAVLSLTVYSSLYSVANCLAWVGVIILCQFVMFSVATFAAVITGNTLALAGLNLLLHVAVMIFAACISLVAEDFLYGFVSDDKLLVAVVETNPAVWICSIASQMGSYSGQSGAIALNIALGKIPYYIAGSLALYIVSLVLYKKRGMETAEDIAAFRVLNPIFKYLVTFLGTLGVYAVFNMFFDESPVVYLIVVFILAAVIYFACEMLLKKTFRVWRSYKGYLGFGAVFGLMLCIFAFTSFFGYETRIPEVDDIESVAVFNYYYGRGEPYVDNSEIISYSVDKHREMISFRDIIETNNRLGDSSTRIHFRYKLKDGKTFQRVYKVKQGTSKSIMTDLYKYDDYVMANEDAFREDKLFRVSFSGSNYEKYISDPEQIAEFVKAYQSDVLSLDYNEMYVNSHHWDINFEIQYEMPSYPNDGPTSTAVAVAVIDDMQIPQSTYIDYSHHSVNANYKNTLKWLRDNGFGNVASFSIASPVTIVDMSGVEDDEYKSFYEMVDSGVEIARIDNAEKYPLIADYIVNMPVDGSIEDEYKYAVCHKFDNGEVSRITEMTQENVDELLEIIK